MIREIRPSDIPRLKEMQGEYKWDFESDFIDGLVAVDENDNPIMAVGAWMLAEVHCVMDGRWSTPGARLTLLRELHDTMSGNLKRRGYKQAVTWFDAIDRFCRRLERWGWIRSTKSSFHRSVY